MSAWRRLTVASVFIFLLCSGHADAANDPLSLRAAFQHADVVLVGWTHLAQNNFVPEALAGALSDLKEVGALTYAVESTDFLIDPMLRDPNALATSKSWQGYVDADPMHGRPWWNLLELAARKKINVLALDEIHRPEGTEAQDRLFAKKIRTELALGRKVLILIGDNHVEGIEYLLRDHRVATISTDYDLQTGEVQLNGIKVGQSGVSQYHAKLERVLSNGKDLVSERLRMKAEGSWVHPVIEASTMPVVDTSKTLTSRVCSFLLSGLRPLKSR